MKKHLFTVVSGCLGLCAGFTLCYVYLVLPQRETEATGSAPQQIRQQVQTATPIASDGKPTTITVASDGSLYLAGERIDLSRLATQLKELAAQQRPVAIRSDKNVEFRRIVEVIDGCKAAGVTQIAFATATTQ